MACPAKGKLIGYRALGSRRRRLLAVFGRAPLARIQRRPSTMLVLSVTKIW